MSPHSDLSIALAAAVPGLVRSEEDIRKALPAGSDIMALQRFLGTAFCCEITYDQLGNGELEEINALTPLTSAKLVLDVSGLYDEDGMPIGSEEDLEECDEPSAWFMPHLQDQLKPHGLQLGELIAIGENYVDHENGRVVCLTSDPEKFRQLVAALKPFDLSIQVDFSWP